MSWADMIANAPGAPAFVGADLQPYPYISGYALALRVAAFSLPSNGELSRLGFANRREVDVLNVTQRPCGSRTKFIRALGIEKAGVERFWSPDAWSPLDCPGLFDRGAHRMRHCWECARHGYHCALFQLPSIDRCPWHGCVLSDVCAECGEVHNARFNDSGQLGVCRCGYELMDRSTALGRMKEFPAAVCESWVSSYIAWVRREQGSRLLYVSEHAKDWRQAFAVLAAPPVELQSRDGLHALVEPMCFEGAGPDPAPDSLWGWSQLDGTQEFRSAPLPRYAFEALKRESLAVVSKVGGQVVTAASTTGDTQLVGGWRLGGSAAPLVLLAPYGLYENGQAWLNLSVVDKDIASTCGRSLAMAAAKFCGPLDVMLSPPVSTARSLGLLDGRRHLLSAMLAILCKGYSEGLSAVIRRLRPRLTASSSLLTSPIIEIEILRSVVVRVRVVWVELVRTGYPAKPTGQASRKPLKQRAVKRRRSSYADRSR